MPKKPKEERMDAVAAIEFINACMRAGDWQHRVLAEIANVSFDLNVPCGSPWWPQKRLGNSDAMLVYLAAQYAYACLNTENGGEAIFEAGIAMEKLRARHDEVMKGRSGGRTKGVNHHVFYLIGESFLNRGQAAGTAYSNAKKWCEKNGRSVPTNAAWRKWIERRKQVKL